MDGVGVDAGTEQSGGPTWSERAGGDQGRVDAGLGLDLKGGVSESVGDEAGRHVVPLVVVGADMMVERCLGGSVVLLKVECKTASGLAGAEEWIVGGGMTYFLAANAVLLVRELQSRVGYLEDSLVMQRRGRSVVDLAVDVEVDVLEAEGLGTAIFQGVGVFGRAKEPEEGKDAEVDDMAVGLAPLGVLGVKGIKESSEDGGVDRVGPAGRVIFVAEPLDERRE